MESTFARKGMQRIRIGSVAAVARVTLVDQDGSAADTAETLTADLARIDGTVLATGRATADVAGTGRYTVTLTDAECATLDIIQITWVADSVTRAVTFHRIVGGFMFRVDELADLDGMSGFEPGELLTARDWVTDLIETNTGAAWCPTYDVEQFTPRFAGCSRALNVRPIRSLRSLSIEETAQTVADVDVNEASGILSGVTFYGRCVAGVEHGFDEPTALLRDAALEGARDHVLRKSSGLSDRTRSITNDLGVQQQFSYAGKDHPTGIDSVDAAIRAHDKRLPGLA